MSFHEIQITVNGVHERVSVKSNQTLMLLLRETLALTGTKSGCSAGECGACTVLIDGVATRSCAMESRWRTVTVSFVAGSLPSPRVSKSTVTQNGVPISSCRR